MESVPPKKTSLDGRVAPPFPLGNIFLRDDVGPSVRRLRLGQTSDAPWWTPFSPIIDDGPHRVTVLTGVVHLSRSGGSLYVRTGEGGAPDTYVAKVTTL